MEDLIFLKTAQICIAIVLDIMNLLFLDSMWKSGIYISRKSSENSLTRMPPPPAFRNKLLTIFVLFEAVIPKPHMHVENMNKVTKFRI